MNIKIKTYIIILTTFTCGILVGVLLNRTLMRDQYQHRIERMRNPKGFLGMFNHIIEPDAAQRKEIREILQKRSRQIFEIGEESRREISTIMDSLRAEIEPLLTEEQKRRLKQRIERFREFEKMRPRFRQGRGPRHGMPMDPPPPPPRKDDLH